MIFRSLILTVLIALALPSCGEGGAVDLPRPIGEPLDSKGWALVWSDEFSGEEIDRKKWTPETSCWGGGNNERQCYTDRSENLSITDGYLTITARPEIFTGVEFTQKFTDRGGQVTREYTSGKLRTLDLHSWTYGRFEARIQLPQGQSTWAAFWMLPQDDHYGGWPLSGEIDIMEAVNLGAFCAECNLTGIETRSLGALHFGKPWPQNQYRTGYHTLTQDKLDSDQFYIFAVEWGEGRINWLVDGVVYFSMTQDDWFTDAVLKKENPTAPFNQPFYLMLNLAVGGNLPDNKNEKTFNPDSFPAHMKIDWVRVYQCAGDAQTGLACMLPVDPKVLDKR